MIEKNAVLLEGALKEYYFNHFDLIQIPPKPTQREFGYQKVNGGMIRHLTVKDNKELHLLLMKEVPSDVYCSNAYYLFPSMPMSEKDWQGADLIFDIDAKDLALPCRSDHTAYRCISCNEVVPKLQSICNKCGSAKFERVSVSCKNCIDESKKEVRKLIDILDSDLGIKREEIMVHFSGNEGFHVRAMNSGYEKLGSQERADLVDYIMFNGVMPETFGVKKQGTSMSMPELGEAGWRGRVAKSLFSSRSKVPKVTREIALGGYSAFQVRLEGMRQTVGVRVDPKVTMDIHRIFRLEGSVNSKSGLSKVRCNDLEKFDPYSDACMLGEDEVEVLANCPLQIKLKKKKYGPYVMEKVSVPKFVAVYMICKGLASSI